MRYAGYTKLHCIARILSSLVMLEGHLKKIVDSRWKSYRMVICWIHKNSLQSSNFV